jgi:hypothetical protein
MQVTQVIRSAEEKAASKAKAEAKKTGFAKIMLLKTWLFYATWR